MANNQNSSSGIRQPGDVVCIYHSTVKDKKIAAESWEKAAKETLSYKDTVRGYKLCCLEQTEETFRFYRDLDNYEIFDMARSTEIIQKNIDGYVKKNDELEKMIQDTSKKLNDIKVKLHDAHNAASAMSNCIKSLVELPEEEAGAVTQEVTDIKIALTAVMNKAKTLDQEGQAVAEALAHIAGIQTFSNIDSLKDFGKQLVDMYKQFKATIDGHIKKAADDAKSTQTELTKAVDELNEIEFGLFGVTVSREGLSATSDFFCTGQCLPIDCVEDICKEIGNEPKANTPGKPSTAYSRKDQR